MTPPLPRPSRRGLLQGAAAGAAAVGLGRPVRATARARPPNIVVILTDQHTERAIAAHGTASARTPNLDRLAAMGVSFQRSYCADPSCVPARASLLTGRPSSEHGALMNPMELRADLPDLGQWLRARGGPRPVWFGKWHIPGRPLKKSFDLLGYTSSAGENSDLSLVRAFEGFLQNTDPSEPFVAFLALYNPHDIVHLVDIQNTWRDADDLDLGDVALPPLPPNHAVPAREAALMEEVLRRSGRSDRWSESKWRTYRWWYDRQVEMMDGAVGRVLDLVYNSRHAEGTAVILTSDHGDCQGEHGLANKQALYEASARVPMMVAWPGGLEGRGVDRDHLVSGLDLVPTVCELVGQPAPPDQRGRSLLPLLRDAASPWRDHLQVQSLVEGRLLATRQHTWIGFRGDPVQQLFDVQADPWQTRDLGDDPAHDGTRAELAALSEAVDAGLQAVPLALEGYAAVQEALGRG